LVNLVGLRHTLANSAYAASSEDNAKIVFEMNRAVALWADDTKVSNLLRDVRAGQTVDNFTRLLRAMSEHVDIPLDRLSDDDLHGLFVKRNFGPAT
jgi:hypothetical protein